MTTKFDIGEQVYIPAKIEGIHIDVDGAIKYKITTTEPFDGGMVPWIHESGLVSKSFPKKEEEDE